MNQSELLNRIQMTGEISLVPRQSCAIGCPVTRVNCFSQTYLTRSHISKVVFYQRVHSTFYTLKKNPKNPPLVTYMRGPVVIKCYTGGYFIQVISFKIVYVQ